MHLRKALAAVKIDDSHMNFREEFDSSLQAIPSYFFPIRWCSVSMYWDENNFPPHSQILYAHTSDEPNQAVNPFFILWAEIEWVVVRTPSMWSPSHPDRHIPLLLKVTSPAFGTLVHDKEIKMQDLVVFHYPNIHVPQLHLLRFVW